MPSFNSYAKLRALSTDALIELYDQRAQHTEIGVAFIREEMARRENEVQTAAISRMTKQMRDMTIAIAVLTVINLIVAAIPVFK